jgi:hypothetical protein
MSPSYAVAYDLLEAFVRARRDHDGDAFTGLFADDARMSLDPFTPPLAGHNALRAYLLQAANDERQYDLTVERHWVSGDAILAAWHASWNRGANGAVTRQAGFLVAELNEDGQITQLRLWAVSRERPAG